MSELLVVAVVPEAAATRIALWQGAAQRHTERIPHGALVLAMHDRPAASVRRRIRQTAVNDALARLGEDATRPDAFVALGTGASAAGVYIAAEPADPDAADCVAADDVAADGAALVYELGAAARVPAYTVEARDQADGSNALDHASALLVRAAARRDAVQRQSQPDAGRLVLSLEPRAHAHALVGERIVTSVAVSVGLPADPDPVGLMRRSDQGDAAAADQLAAFVDALHGAALDAARALQEVLVVVLTGTLAVHARLADEVARLVRAVAPVHLLPGIHLERALADAAHDVLLGRTPARSHG